jgi:CBS domain containing-hemolysin-like protein
MNFANEFFWIVVTSSLLTGFFSTVSIALRTFRRAVLENALKGDGRRMATFEGHLPALRLMCGFLRSLAGLMLAVAMMYLFEDPPRWGTALWAVLASGAIIGVAGVAVPSAWAAFGGERLLAGTLGLLVAMRYAFWPLLAVLGAFETPIRRLSGAGPQQPPDHSARQEILQAASEGQAEGAVEPAQVRMIHSVIRFRDIRAGEIMTPRTGIFALPVDTSCQDACRLVAAAGHSRVPVYQDSLDNILGILYAKDLLLQAGTSSGPMIRPILRKPFFVPQTQPLDELLKEFQSRKVHLAVVLDEYGGTAGLVTIEDVLEKIVGQIADEHEHIAPELIRRIDARTAEVDGRAPIDALNEALGLRIPPGEDYATAAGLVLAELGYIPSAGETVTVAGARLTVLAATQRQITRLRVEALPQEESAPRPA